MVILETRRLIFRHQVMNDLDSLFALYGDPDVSRYIPDAPGLVKRRAPNWCGTCMGILNTRS